MPLFYLWVTRLSASCSGAKLVVSGWVVLNSGGIGLVLVVGVWLCHLFAAMWWWVACFCCSLVGVCSSCWACLVVSALVGRVCLVRRSCGWSGFIFIVQGRPLSVWGGSRATAIAAFTGRPSPSLPLALPWENPNHGGGYGTRSPPTILGFIYTLDVLLSKLSRSVSSK